MKIRWSYLLVGTVVAGCVSHSAGNPTRPPAGRSAAEVTQDQARCEQHAKAQAKNRGDHFLACMISSGYTVNWDMDNLGWVVGIAQTRPHEPTAVFRELETCDRQADNTKKSTFVPPLPPELESAVRGETKSAGFEGFNQRPRAARSLVACILEHGYAVRPRVPYER